MRLVLISSLAVVATALPPSSRLEESPTVGPPGLQPLAPPSPSAHKPASPPAPPTQILRFKDNDVKPSSSASESSPAKSSKPATGTKKTRNWRLAEPESASEAEIRAELRRLGWTPRSALAKKTSAGSTAAKQRRTRTMQVSRQRRMRIRRLLRVLKVRRAQRKARRLAKQSPPTAVFLPFVPSKGPRCDPALPPNQKPPGC